MKKEKNKKIIKILCAVLLLMTLGMTGYTYAKYVTQEKGNGSADIATWSFRIEKDENEDVKTIRLADTSNKETLLNGKIAPGTSGQFYLKINAVGSEVAVDYKVTFGNEKNKPDNIIFKYDGKTYSSLSEIDAIQGTMGLTDYKSQLIKVEWEWPYETGSAVNGIASGDKVDTQNGQDNLDYTFDVIATGTQSK